MSEIPRIGPKFQIQEPVQTDQTNEAIGSEPDLGGLGSTANSSETAGEKTVFVNEAFEKDLQFFPEDAPLSGNSFNSSLPSSDIGRLLNYIDQPPGPQVSWDTILLISEQASKTNPDWQSVFNALEQLSRADRAKTLEQLNQQGDLPSIINKMLSDPQARAQLGKFMAQLSREEESDPGL